MQHRHQSLACRAEHRPCLLHRSLHRNRQTLGSSIPSCRSTLHRPPCFRIVTTGAFESHTQPADLPQNSKGINLSWLPDKQAVRLVTDAWGLLYSNLWAVVAIFLAKDAAAFVLHRFAHRLTNQIAEVVFSIPISTLGNPWWIMVDAKFMEGHFGYQVLVGIFFLLCLPLNILLNTAAVSTAASVCATRLAMASRQHAVPSASFTGQGKGKVGVAECRSTSSSLDSGDYTDVNVSVSATSSVASRASSTSSPNRCSGNGSAVFRGPGVVSFSKLKGKAAGISSSKSSNSSSSNKRLSSPAQAPVAPWLAGASLKQSQQQKLPAPLGVRPSLAMVKDTWSKQVAYRVKQLWAVDLHFNVWSLPLQAACLAVLPAFWAFPRLLEIQLSLPAAVLGGAQGKEALERSKLLMAGFGSKYAWPFVLLIVAGRVLELVREIVLVSMPARWWTDVIEVPLFGTAVFAAARILLLRMQDLLPLAAYMQRTAQSAPRTV